MNGVGIGDGLMFEANNCWLWLGTVMELTSEMIVTKVSKQWW